MHGIFFCKKGSAKLFLSAGGVLSFMAALMDTIGVSCISFVVTITVLRQYYISFQLQSLNLVCLVV